MKVDQRGIFITNMWILKIAYSVFIAGAVCCASLDEEESSFVNLEKRLESLEIYTFKETTKMQQELHAYKTALEKTESMLQTTQMELAQLKQNSSVLFNEHLRGRRLTSMFRHSADGVVAFSAQMQAHNENLGTHQTLLYQTVKTNYGNGYNKITGMFRCPVAGLYLFIVTTMSFYADVVEAEMVVNGNAVLRLYSGDANVHEQGSNSILYSLHKGDMVWVRIMDNPSKNTPAEHIYGGGWSTFNGVLINAL